MLGPVEAEAGPAYALARPAEQIPVLEVLEIDNSTSDRPRRAFAPEIEQAVEQVKKSSRDALGGLTLADAMV